MSCAWCASTQTCHELNLPKTAFCNYDGCESSCMKISNQPLSPSLCSAYTSAGSCLYAGGNAYACAWCGTSSQCFELNVPSQSDTCPPAQCASSVCLKKQGNPVPPSGSYCSNYTSPGSCLYAGGNSNSCGWCVTSQLCFELQTDAKDTCGASNGKCSYNCLKTAGAEITPSICSKYTSCTSCTYGEGSPNACGWCASSNSCVELGRDYTPCQGACGTLAYTAGPQCPK